MRCCVPGCGQRSEKGISFHRFPEKNPDVAALWVDAILNFISNDEKKSFTPRHDSVVCSKHFDPQDYVKAQYGRSMLKSGTCPTVFLCNPTAKSRRSKKKTPGITTNTLPKIAPKPTTERIRHTSTTDSSLIEISDSIPKTLDPASSTANLLTTDFEKHHRICITPKRKISEVQTMVQNPVESNCSTKMTSRSDVNATTQLWNDEPTNCHNCAILTHEIDKLREEVIVLKDSLVRLKREMGHRQLPMTTEILDATSYSLPQEVSCSTPRSSRMLLLTEGTQVPNSPRTCRRNVELDHRYDSTPTTIKRKLHSSEKHIKMIASTSRITKKRLQRTQLKVTEMKKMIKTLVQQVDLKSEVGKHIEEVFGSVPLEIYKRSSMIHSAGTKKVKKQYSASLRAFAVTLHFYSPRAYNFVREQFSFGLPHASTIRSWYRELQCAPGLTEDSFTALEFKANEYSAGYKKLYCALMFDDMHLKRQVEWDGTNYHGFCDIGDGADHAQREVEAANQVFVIMAVAIDGSWKVPLGYYFHNGMLADKISEIVVKCLERLYDIGIEVTSVTFDGPSTHFALARKLGANLSASDLQSTFPHPSDTTLPVYCLLDPSHVLKLVRNAWSDSSIFYDAEGNCIEWRFIDKLHEIQEAEGLRAGNKFKKSHLQWKKSPMKVDLAAQTLSTSVADAIDFCRDSGIEAFKGSEATTRFIRIIDRWFDIMNSRNPRGRGLKAPLSTNNESSWRPFLHETISYIRSLKMRDGKFCVDSRKKTGFIGIILSCESITGIFDKLVVNSDTHFQYLLTYKFSQDHLELFFNAIRARGGWCVNPSPRHFTSAYKRLLVRHQIKASNGNVDQMDKTSILFVTRNSVVRYKDTVAQLDTLSTALDRAFSVADDPKNESEGDYDKLDTLPAGSNRETVVQPDFSDVISEMPPNFCMLSEFAENAISFMAGYVVRMVFKRIKCLTCCAVLCNGQASDNRLRLVLQKTNGGLILPSPDVIKICLVTEMKYRRMTCGIPSSTPGFNHTLANMVFADLAENNLFPELDEHMFDMSPEENHTVNLIKTVALCYIRIKMFHEGKKVTETITDIGKRKKLSRLAIFLSV